VKHTTHQKLARRKRDIEKRLARRRWQNQVHAMFSASNIGYELADRDRAVTCGGIGVIHLLARRLGLPQAIDDNIHVLKRHLPYQESDHVLNLAYNILAGGTCIEDLEHLRTDVAYLDALGAKCIPDPTTAGDFCRRFETDQQILQLMEVFNAVRLKVWKQQPSSFFAQAIIDADGTIAPTTGQCKQGMDISYDGQWGYHPLLISLANTREPLYLVNRPGNRPSYEQAGDYLDRAIAFCREAGFLQILLRGDTDFSQTTRLDGWDGAGVRFIFGIDAMANLKTLANDLPQSAWRRLERPARYVVQTEPRQRPENVKEKLVVEHEYKNIRLLSEDVAEFQYQPTACKKTYRMVVVRKNLSVEKGEARLYDDIRYFFYITNVGQQPAEQIVLSANDRCDQENLIEQLKNGVRSMGNPLDNLHSNWAYMVMSSLAWTLKAWCGLLLPVQPGRYQARHQQQKQSLVRMEFKGFLNAMMRLPCQIVQTGRRILYRLMSWNPWTSALMRLAEAMRRPLRC